MKHFPRILALAVFTALLPFAAAAQEATGIEILPLSQMMSLPVAGDLYFDPATGIWHGTNGVFVRYGTTVLTADAVSVDSKAGEVAADGNVRIQNGAEIWMGDHVNYNFKTRSMRTEQFHAGKAPVFAGAESLGGNSASNAYAVKNGYVTTDDFENPAYRVRASSVKILPGKYVRMWNAVLLAGNVPVFYFPYYQRSLGDHSGNFNFTPGFRSSYGGYMLTTYDWFLGDVAEGSLHLDYRTKRGVGLGPDVKLHLGQWGEANLRYYYLHDVHPDGSDNDQFRFGNIPNNRQRVYADWQATPATNLNVKALLNYQTDPLVLRDFYTGEYDANPQPRTFVEVQKYSDNWSLDAMVAPRVNNFFGQVERLPDVKLTGYRQQILNTPLYYDSESSISWNRVFFSNATNGLYTADGLYADQGGYFTDSAMRADTYHQVSLPWQFFRWLNVTPHAGGRFTYYNRGSYASGNTDEISRATFDTGLSVGFKASALWRDAHSSFLEVDGLRHVIEPSANYSFVTRPSKKAEFIPQIDPEMQALLISPVTFPDYNSIDSLDYQNVIRLEVRNLLQTKRGGQLDDLVNWNLMLDCRLDSQDNQSKLNDLYSQLAFRPRSWLTLEEKLRYDTEHGNLNLSFHQIMFAPDDRWSWGIGHLYIRGGAWDRGMWEPNNFMTSAFFYRVNDNWGLRAQHDINIETGRLQRQSYSVYRDLRSWTAALTLRWQDDHDRSSDVTVAFQLSLKARPLHRSEGDVENPLRLVGE